MARKKRRRLNVKFLVGLVCVAGALLLGGLLASWWYIDSPERAVRRAQAAEAEGDWEEAAAKWASAARKAGGDIDYQVRAINAAMHLTTRDDGEEWISRINQNYTLILSTDPTNEPALRGQLRLLSGHRGFNAAVPTYPTREVRRLAIELLRHQPQDPEALTLRAIATVNLAQFTGEGITPDQLEQARNDLRTVATSGKSDGMALLALTQRHLQEAEQTLARGNPDGALRNWQNALQQVDQIAQLHPMTADAGQGLDEARVQWRIGNAYSLLARAKPYLDYQKLIRSGQTPAQVDRGRLMQEPVVVATQEKALERLAAARQALDNDRDALEEDYYNIRASYADALLQQQKPEEAEQELRALLAVRPWDAQASSVLGQFLLQRGQLTEALEVIEEAIKREQEPLPDLLGNAGLNARLARLGTKPTMVDLILTKRELSRDTEERQRLLAQAKDLLDQFESQRKAAAYPLTAMPMRLTAQILMAEGDVAASMQMLTEALRMTEGAQSPPDRQERLKALALMVDANQRLDQVGGQQRYLEEMIQISPAPALRRQLAQLLNVTGQHERARAIAEELLREEPDNPANLQILVSSTPAGDRERTYATMPEGTTQQRRAKLNAALSLNNTQEVRRLVTQLQAELPPEGQRNAQQQQQSEALTLALAQQVANSGKIDEAIAIAQPLAERNESARMLVAQWQGGAAALVDSMPDGPAKLLNQAQLAEQQGNLEDALAKLLEARRIAPQDDVVTERLYNFYLLRGRFDDADALGRTLQGRNVDGMNGRSFAVRTAVLKGEPEAIRLAASLAADFPNTAEAQAMHAEALRRAGQYSDAIDGFRRALELSPNNMSALTGMISSLEAGGRAQEMRQYIDAGLRMQPNNPFFRSADENYQLQFGDPAEVIASRQRVVAENPEDVQGYLDLGRVLVLAAGAAERAGEPGRARQYLSEATQALVQGHQKFPSEPRFIQGIVSAGAGAGQEVLAAIEPVISAAVAAGSVLSTDPMAVAAAAEFYARGGNMARAESIVREALGAAELSREQKAGMLMVLSQILALQERYEDAAAVLDGYEEIPAVLDRKVELLANRVNLEPRNEQVYEALLQVTKEPLESGKLSVPSMNALAFAELRRNNEDRAVRILDQALQKQPGHPRTLFFRAAAEARRSGGNLDLAAEWLEQSRRVRGGDADVLRELARVQLQRGRLEEALGALSRLVELNPQDVPTRLELVNLLLGLTPPRIAEAARQFRDAERAGVSEDPAMLMAQARMEWLRDRRDDAVRLAQRAMERSAGGPQGQVIFNNYLLILLMADRHQDVVQRTQAMASATGSDAAPWWALRARGEALAKLGRHDEAVAAYRQAAAQVRDAPFLEMVVLDANRHLGFEPAYDVIRDLVQPADGSQPQVRHLLVASALHAASGRTDEAIEQIEKVREMPDLDGEQRLQILSQLGTLYMQAVPRRLEESEACFRAVLETQPNSMGVLNNLAYALTLQGEQGRDEHARTKLSEAVEFGRQAYELATQASNQSGQNPNPIVTDTYAWALGVSGMTNNDARQLEESVRLLRAARSVAEATDARFPELYVHLSRVLAAQRQGRAAQESAEAGLLLVDQMTKEQKQVDPLVRGRLEEALDNARHVAAEVATESTVSRE